MKYRNIPLRPIAVLIGLFFLVFNLATNAQTLFDDDEPLYLILETDIGVLKNDKSADPVYITGRLIWKMDDNQVKIFDIKVKARGGVRRVTDLCGFPPIKLNFKKSQVENTVFQEQDKLKMVLQCREDHTFENYIFEEYLIYKTYNLITPESYQVRLVNITVKDTQKNEESLEMHGFIIEDDETFAKRINATLFENTVHSQDSCEASSIDKMALFQFMIGNTDWYVNTRHNISIFQRNENGNLIAVPFDFDFAGVINTMYASPSKEIPIENVTERYFKGGCRAPGALDSVISLFNERKQSIEDLYNSFNTVPDYVIKKDLKYYGRFYKIINDSVETSSYLYSVCNRPPLGVLIKKK